MDQMRDVDLQNTLRMNLVMMRTIMLDVIGMMGLVVTMREYCEEEM